MATINYFVSGKKRKTVPVYVRLSSGKGIDLINKTGVEVDPSRWSNKTQTIKQRILTEDDNKLIGKLKKLRDHIESERKDYYGDLTKEWLTSVIDSFYNKKTAEAKTLNDYISTYIKDSKAGTRKNKSELILAEGTIKAWEGFQRIFNEYQGIYTKKRIEELKKAGTPLRREIRLDFEDITLTFISDFKSFLSHEGYKQNTIWRFVKELKFFMQRSLDEKKTQ